jgi:geranylgeranyl reductase family protein
MYDAIVAGAGPVGSYVAGRLAAGGHRVLVLEKRAHVGDSVCTGIIGQECVQTFAIEDRVILREASSASLFSPSGNCLHLQREEPQACILDRAAFDISMAERAQKTGADFQFNSRVLNVAIEGDRAVVSVSRQGKEESLPARVVVIAAGFAPGLIARLGLGVFKDFAIGAQAEVETRYTDEVEVYFGDMAPGFFAWLVPTAPPMARAGLLSRQNPRHYLKRWLEDLNRKGKIAPDEVKIRYGAIPLKPLPRTCGERLIVVGDAAGQVKPTTGGGIYYGLLSAEIAATTLHQALVDDDLSARRLSRYERGWHKKLGRELRIGYWARRFFERLSDRQVDRIFEVIKTSGIDEALLKAKDLSFDWHGRTIARLLRYQMVSKTLNLIKLPFMVGRIDR